MEISEQPAHSKDKNTDVLHMRPINIENQKRILKNSVFLYIRMFFVLLVSLYTIRIVLNNLEVVDYGIYTAIGGVVLSLSFLSQVLASASQRFFAYELGLKENGIRLNKIFNTILISYVGIALLIVLLAESIGLWFMFNKMTIPAERMDAALWVFQFALLSFVVTIMTNPYIAVVIASEHMNIYAYVGIIDVILKLLIACLLIISPIDKLKLYSVLMFVESCITASIYICICRKKFTSTKFSFFWDKTLFKTVFSYSSWTLFGTVAGVCNNQGANILLNVFIGPSANAAYAIGHQAGSAVSGFSSSFYSAVRPQLTKSYAANDMAYMYQLFYFSSKVIFLLLFVIILPLISELELILNLWLDIVEPYMIIFTRLILIYTMIICLSEPITTIAQASGQVKKYHGIVDGFALIALPLSYFALKNDCPPQSVFYITILVFSIAHFLRLIVLQRIIVFSIAQYIKNYILPIAVIIIASIGITQGVHYLFNNIFLRFFTVLFTAILAIFTLGYYILFTEDEISILRSLFCNRKPDKPLCSNR